MSKQDDELFRAWWPTGDGSPEAAFAAGREAERERILAIIATIQTDPDGACAAITRRIKEQEK